MFVSTETNRFPFGWELMHGALFFRRESGDQAEARTGTFLGSLKLAIASALPTASWGDLFIKYRLDNRASFDVLIEAFEKESGWVDENTLGDDMTPFTGKEVLGRQERLRRRVAQLLSFDNNRIHQFFLGLMEHEKGSVEKLSDFKDVARIPRRLGSLWDSLRTRARVVTPEAFPPRLRRLEDVHQKLRSIVHAAVTFSRLRDQLLKLDPSVMRMAHAARWQDTDWRRIARAIAAPENHAVHKTDLFRDEMTAAILDVDMTSGHRNIFYSIVGARLRASYRSLHEISPEWSGTLKYISVLAERLATIRSNKKLSGVWYTNVRADDRRLGKLYDLIRERSHHGAGGSISFRIPGSEKTYVPHLEEYPDFYVIRHAPDEVINDILPALDLLWGRIFSAPEAEGRYKALAEYEWWIFWSNILGRGGAAIGDAMSIIAQRALGLKLRPEYAHADFEALSTPSLDAYIARRVGEFRQAELVRTPEFLDQKKRQDEAEVAASRTQVDNGGIDMSAGDKVLDMRTGNRGINFDIDPAMLQKLENANGLYPVIINVRPMTNFRLLFD